MITKLYTVVPIKSVLEKTNSCFSMNVSSASELMTLLEKKNSHWLRLDNWENLTDAEIFNHFEQIRAPIGKVYVISEVSYREGLGAFSLDENQIRSFVADHLTNFDECLFNGDVLILDTEKSSIWAFHHEGAYAIFDLSST